MISSLVDFYVKYNKIKNSESITACTAMIIVQSNFSESTAEKIPSYKLYHSGSYNAPKL